MVMVLKTWRYWGRSGRMHQLLRPGVEDKGEGQRPLGDEAQQQGDRSIGLALPALPPLAEQILKIRELPL